MLLNKLIFLVFLSIKRSIFGAAAMFLPEGREGAARAVGTGRPSAGKSDSLSIGGEPGIDRRDRLIDDGVTHAVLRGDRLHQPVGPLDIGRAVVERPGGRGRSHQVERRGGVFIERY